MEKEKNELIIEAFSIEDTFEIQRIIQEASRSVYVQGGKTQEEIEKEVTSALSEENIKKVRESLSTLTENEKIVVAKVDGKIAGFVYIEKGEEKNILQAAFVLPQFQGKGIATKLWNNVKDFLNPKVDTYLDVISSNTNAINFYKKIGFVETGEVSAGRLLPEMKMVLKSQDL
ncbi:MAG: GNAT family N-acetyltransferase [bacterium]